MVDSCPKCGGVALLVQTRKAFVDIPDPTAAAGKLTILEKIEEFRCQDPSCEHEFSEVIREPREP